MLTAQQQAARAGKLTASRIACLMTGDQAAIYRLYQELTGEIEPEDLSKIWPVYWGSATEQAHLDWIEGLFGPFSRRGEVVQHPLCAWGAATLDAWSDRLECPVETKVVAGREPLAVIIDRYQPQMQWQIDCTAANQCALSIVVNNNEPIVEMIPRDEAYAVEMRERGTQFMDHVSRREPPVDPPPPPVPAPEWDKLKAYDMSEDAEWGRQADRWLQTEGAASIAKEAEKELKKLVPADARRCDGNGITIARDRGGRLALRRAYKSGV